MALTITLIGLCGVLAVLLGHAAWVWLLALVLGREPRGGGGGDLPHLSVIVAFHGTGLLPAKLANLLALDYPAERLEVLLVSDGPLAGEIALPDQPGWRLLATDSHEGKAHALNAAVAQASGAVLVFTDLDAMLPPDALRHLVRPLADAEVGGVCGQRVIGETVAAMDAAQSDYVRFDSHIKRLESRLGILSSGDGKLYAIRRALFRPIAATATDDSYNTFSVIAGGMRMVFEPRAVAVVPKPSRDPAHELSRRRRVVARSLHGIWLNRRLLVARPLFGVAVLLNKVARRLLPLFLLLLLAGSVAGAATAPLLALLAAAQLGFYGLAALHRLPLPKPLRRLAGTAFYFTLGNVGMLLGVIDFLSGRRVAKWTPNKGGGG